MNPWLGFKKAYTKIFSGKHDLRKGIIAAAIVATSPAAMIYHATPEHDGTRTADIGDRQYRALTAQLDKMTADIKEEDGLRAALDTHTQEAVLKPNDKDLQKKIADEKARYRQLLTIGNGDRDTYINGLLSSRGISEKDAVYLIREIETRGIGSLDAGLDMWTKNLRYLDECQDKVFSKSIAADAKTSYSNDVWVCQSGMMEAADIARYTLAMEGFGGAAGALISLSALGAAFRRSIPKHEERVRTQEADRRRKAEANGSKKIIVQIK